MKVFTGPAKKGDFLTRILATGTFDLLHPGHVYFLSRARSLGDELYVIVARDSNITHKPKPIVPEEQRVEMVSALGVVEKALLGSENDIFEPLKEIRPDIIALGYDQRFDPEQLENELEKRGLPSKVVRIPFSKDCPLCSTGAIIKEVLKRHRSVTPS